MVVTDTELANEFAAMMRRLAKEANVETFTLDVGSSSHICAYAHRGGKCAQGIGDTLPEAINTAVQELNPPLPFAPPSQR
jgi:hypothetical protein